MKKKIFEEKETKKMKGKLKENNTRPKISCRISKLTVREQGRTVADRIESDENFCKNFRKTSKYEKKQKVARNSKKQKVTRNSEKGNSLN